MLLKKAIKTLLNKWYSTPITIKVTAWYTFFIVSLLVISVSSSLFISNRFVKEGNQRELIFSVREMSQKGNKFEEFSNGIFFLYYNRRGGILAGKIPKGFDLNLPVSFHHATLVETPTEDFLYFDGPIHHRKAGYGWIRGILPLGKSEENLKMLLLLFSISSPLLLFFIVYGGYRIIKNSFRPVRDISHTALEIQQSKDFSKRIPLEKGNDEIHKMASTFNQMLDILEHSYLHEKQFSSDVSHELRTPITVILAESDYALKYSDSLEETKVSLEVIQRQAKRMSTLIHQIMELSRLEQQHKIPREIVSLPKLIYSVLQDYKYSLEEKKIQLTLDLNEEITILANSLMMEQVFDNLLNNALKFTKSKITLRLYQEEKEVIFEIEDDGIGLSQKEIESIWNRFYQTTSSRNKEENQGYGLGLSMVHRILALHEASIDVESELKKGSKFIIRFQGLTENK